MLKAKLIGGSVLKARMSVASTLSAKLVEGGVTVVVANAEYYDGPYEVTPDTLGRSLATEGRYMTENVSVKAIPYYETSNEAGGSTLYIASEVE